MRYVKKTIGDRLSTRRVRTVDVIMLELFCNNVLLSMEVVNARRTTLECSVTDARFVVVYLFADR